MSQELYDKESREKLLIGINKIANAVRKTLGSKGRKIILDKEYGYPTVTKDGVTVADSIDSKDRFINLAILLIKEVASDTNDDVNDGTTTATVLAQALIQKGMELIDSGHNEISLVNQLEKYGKQIIEKIKEMSVKIEDNDIEKVASISSNDPVIGKKIAEAMKLIGKNGVITVEESQWSEMEIEVVKGVRINNGFHNSYMATNMGKEERPESVLNNVGILVTDKKISSNLELAPLVEKMMNSKINELLVLADDFSREVLNTCLKVKLEGGVNILPIRLPFGGNKKDVFQDIATITGAKLISDELKHKLEDVEIKDFGSASKVITNKDHCTIIQGAGNSDEIKVRLESVKELISKTQGYDKDKLNDRLGMLNNGAAIIKVGAITETQMTEIKHRIDDAVGATKAAVEEGVVAGGGVTLIRACEELGDSPVEKLLKEALEKPSYYIAHNSGANGDEVVEKIRNEKGAYGFNASTNEYGDMIQLGIIDPVKVTRLALENALSIASLILAAGGSVIGEK